jgi:Outer membrane protein beta-barrel domain
MKKVILLIAVLLLIASPAMAKEGFYLGLFYPTETISGDAGSGTSSGGGWGVRAGTGFNRYFSIEGRYSDTTHDSHHLKGLAGDLKLNFPLTSLDSAQIMTVEPYIMGGYAHYEISGAGTPKSDGLQYGIGIELYLFRELSVQVGWTDSKVKFQGNTGDVKTVDFGFIYHFI